MTWQLPKCEALFTLYLVMLDNEHIPNICWTISMNLRNIPLFFSCCGQLLSFTNPSVTLYEIKHDTNNRAQASWSTSKRNSLLLPFVLCLLVLCTNSPVYAVPCSYSFIMVLTSTGTQSPGRWLLLFHSRLHSGVRSRVSDAQSAPGVKLL